MCLSTTDEEGRKVKKTTAIITIVIALVLLFSCVFALCACNERTNPNAFKNDTRFAVDYDNLNMMDMNKKLVGIIVEAAIDKNNTYFDRNNEIEKYSKEKGDNKYDDVTFRSALTEIKK